jgi:hypothetical protein
MPAGHEAGVVRSREHRIALVGDAFVEEQRLQPVVAPAVFRLGEDGGTDEAGKRLA